MNPSGQLGESRHIAFAILARKTEKESAFQWGQHPNITYG
jgi:hypothetical protein